MTNPLSRPCVLCVLIVCLIIGFTTDATAAVSRAEVPTPDSDMMQVGDGGAPPTTEPCECDWEKEISSAPQTLPPCNSGTTTPTDPWSMPWPNGNWSAAAGSMDGCRPSETRARSHGMAALSVVCSTSGSGRTLVRVKHVGAECSCATVTAELSFTFSVSAVYVPGGAGEAKIKCNTGMWAVTNRIQINGSREGSASSQSLVTASTYTFSLSSGIGSFSGTPGSTAQSAGLQFNQSASGIMINTTPGTVESCHGLTEVSAAVSACSSINPTGPGTAEAVISSWSGSMVAVGRCCCKSKTASW